MKLRCIIIDDEYLARQRLLKLLEEYDELVVVAECRNGKEAIEKVHLKEPDLIFLDIQMPDMDGFTVLSKIKTSPYVIFSTAYDQYAIKAFEINAVDYLLKPFDSDRLAIAIQRVLKLKKEKIELQLEKKVKSLLSIYESRASNFISKIVLKQKGYSTTILIDDVVYFQSDGNYVRIVTNNKSYLYRRTMNDLSKELDMNIFIRIHRSIIVNSFYVSTINYIGNNEFRFKLKNKEELNSSRSYKELISRYLSKNPH